MARRPGTMATATCRRNAGNVAHLCCILAFFCAASSALAQYRFDSWTTENGLPNNWVMALRQTRDGYLWLTTADGLARFDGVNFRVFNKVNTPGLTTNWFSYRALWEDAQGNLWMGTRDGGVVRYHDGIFTSLTAKDGLPCNEVIRIDEDDAGTIWITTGSGIVRWRNGHLVLPRSDLDRSLDAYLTAPKNIGVDGRLFGLWRFTGGGWQRFSDGHWTPLPLPPGLGDLAKLQIEGIAEDSGRRLWYSLHNREHEYYCARGEHLTVIHGVPQTSATQVCCQDGQGRIWMGNHYGAVGLWQDARFAPLSGIATSNVFQVMEDKEGSLWIATLDRGLYRLRRQVISTYRRPGGLQQANVIGAMWPDASGHVWLSSGGFTRFEGGRFETFYRQGRSHDPWDQANVFSALYADGDGSFWAGMWDGSIVHSRDERLQEEPSLSARIKGRLYVILRDDSGDLWFGGEQGLYRVRNNVVARFTTRDGLPDNIVNIIHEDGAGTLWIGTSSGLVRYAGGGFTPVEGLRACHITALYEDEAGVLWVGTHDDGVFRLERRSNDAKLTRYTTAQGLYSNCAFQILEDDLGYLWMSCDLGLYRVRKQELNDLAAGGITPVTSTHFGPADGLSGECNSGGQPMAFKASDGRLWFATQDGISVVDPRAIPLSRTPPPVRIGECLLDRQPVSWRSTLKVYSGQANLEINYTALSFIRSDQIRFRYRLEGLDRDWVEAGTRRTAYYSHLPPGQYVFRVIAANSDGVWNTEGESLPVVVLPPFYRTWWFLTLASLLAVGAVVLAGHYRVSRLKQARATQETFSRQLMASQEAERKRVAAELHDSLGQSLAIIKNRALLSLSTPGDLERAQEQLREISAASAEAIEEVKEIAHNLRPYQLDRLGLTRTIEAMIRKVAEARNLRLTLELDRIDGLFPPEAEIGIFRILQEGISNVVKHAEASEARVSIRKDIRVVQITIQDNGRGFVPETVSTDAGTRRGFGLMGMAERTRLLGGSYNLSSIPGHGTTMTIVVDLKDERKPGMS
jgi:signal transduction histidine kinase/ligand-binding sensor domain-containing protein